jgi:hypothetical protein
MYSPQPPKHTYPLTHTWHVKCERCWGKGCYTDDGYSEMYCDCEAGKWRRIYDGGNP